VTSHSDIGYLLDCISSASQPSRQYKNRDLIEQISQSKLASMLARMLALAEQ